MRVLTATALLATLTSWATLASDQAYRKVERPFEGRSLQIAVPDGYSEEQSASPQAGTHTIVFAGPIRGDGTRPMVQLTVIKLPAEVSLAQFAEQMIKGVERRRTDWECQTSDVKIGEVPGRRFAWTGTATVTGSTTTARMGGVMYVGIDADIGFALHTQDFEAYASSALPIGEASLRTFRVK